MKKERRIWTNQELQIAYYIAKFGYVGLKLSREEIMKYVIIGSTVKSLDMQVANFRWLLGIDGPQLTDASLAMRGVVINFDNRTKTQVKSIVLDYIRGLSRVQDYFESIKQQKEIKASVASTNEQLEINFQKNLSMASRGKNLIPKR